MLACAYIVHEHDMNDGSDSIAGALVNCSFVNRTFARRERRIANPFLVHSTRRECALQTTKLHTYRIHLKRTHVKGIYIYHILVLYFLNSQDSCIHLLIIMHV